MHYINMKQKLINIAEEIISGMTRISQDPTLSYRFVQETQRRMPGASLKTVLMQIQEENVGWKDITTAVRQSQTIIFSAEQAAVFMKVAKDYTFPLEYKLPFSHTLLQFSEKVLVPILNTEVDSNQSTPDYLIAMLLYQDELGNHPQVAQEILKKNPFNLLHVPQELRQAKPDSVLNGVLAIWSDWNHSRFGWLSDSQQELIDGEPETDLEDRIQKSWIGIKRLAIACVGYINCENIYLHREGGADEATNVKRERKGKSRLEPYYVCRIRGVQYDKTDATGTGSTHGIRYDVRGHFRRLTTGKTTWVRPHQRGLANELYVPKMYLVDKQEAT